MNLSDLKKMYKDVQMQQVSLADVRSLLHTRLTDREVERWFLVPNSLLGNDLPINYVRARELQSVLSAAHAVVDA